MFAKTSLLYHCHPKIGHKSKAIFLLIRPEIRSGR